MGEGLGCKSRPELPNQKDAQLDVVAWREFNDARKGKLIAFGQCATGQNWRDKLLELPPTQDWCTYWMKDRPATWPVRMFFVPHRVEFKHWMHTCVQAGILFDRCRIAVHTTGIDEDLRERCRKWATDVLEDVRKP